MFKEFEGHIDVFRIAQGQLVGDFQHVLGKQGHPRGAVGLFQIAPGRQRSAAIKDANVVEAQKAPSKTLRPVRSLRLTHQVKLRSSL